MIIWTIVWWSYMYVHDTGSAIHYYICGGLIFSGIAFVLIGGSMGQIGRQAKGADAVTPTATTGEEAAATPTVNPVTSQVGTPVIMMPAAPVQNVVPPRQTVSQP